MTKRSPFRDRASRGGCILAVVSYPVQVCGIHEPEKIGTIPETGVGLKTRKIPGRELRSRQAEKIRERERGTVRFLIGDPAVFVVTHGRPFCRHFAVEAAICSSMHAWTPRFPMSLAPFSRNHSPGSPGNGLRIFSTFSRS